MSTNQTQNQRIIKVHRSRSATYYYDNYEKNNNPSRIIRLHRVDSILSQIVTPGVQVLDAGAGPAVLCEMVRRLSGIYVATDLSWNNLFHGRKRTSQNSLFVSDIVNLPISDSGFGVVVSLGCLEYVPDLPRAVHEMVRVIRPGGNLVASFANSSSPARWWEEGIAYPLIRLKKYVFHGEHRGYSRFLWSSRKVTELFSEAGMEVQALDFFNPGLVGYPFSMLSSLAKLQTTLSDRFCRLDSTNTEFLVHAKKVTL